MSATPDFSEQQLSVARATINHTDGQAIHTLENLKGWMESYGLVAYRPVAAQLGCPAPSLIEATLGTANAAPTLAESATARSLMTRFVGEGGAVALNLLGSPGEQPDFLVTAPLFAHVFTLSGDKTWKQPPVTSGAGKVSTLALNAYTALSEKSMTAAELVAELGREVTEAAILRALNELWAQLRVLPVYQLDESATLWELASRRFTRALKAGGNAGVPTALSALLPFYLAQAVAASEEEVAGFFSPLLARSRTRDVLHALVAARQLETLVVDGKTLLYISGTLPEFAPAPEIETSGPEITASSSAQPQAGGGRIKRFEGGERPQRAGQPTFRTGKPAFGSRPAFGDRPKRSFGAKSSEGERERRPFRQPGTGSGVSGGEFRKPWQEERPRRTEDSGGSGEGRPNRKPFAPRDGGGDRPKRDFKPRSSASDRPERGSFERPRAPRPGGFDRPRGEFKPQGEFRPRTGGKDHPQRTPFDRKPFAPREGGSGERPRRPFTPREGGERTGRPFTPREGGSGDRPRRPFTPREGGAPFGERPRRPFTPREGGAPAGERPRRPFTPREGGSGDRPRQPFTPREGSGGENGRRPFTPREGGRPAFGGRPGGAAPGRAPSKFGGGKPGGRTFGDKPPRSMDRPPRSMDRPPRRKPEGDEQA